MKSELKISEINPFVRLVQKISGTKEDYYVPWRIIYDFEFVFIVKGTFLLRKDNGNILLNPGDFVIIPPFLKHKQEIPESCSYYACHLDFYTSNNNFAYEDVYVKPCDERYESGIILEELSDRNIYAPEKIGDFLMIHVNDEDLVRSTFDKMFQNFSKDDEVSKLLLKSDCLVLISAIFELLGKSNVNQENNTEAVNLFIDYISRHFADKVELVDISQQYGFSPNYFRKIFKQMTNSAPGQYITSIRLREAKKLLELNMYSVEKVGEMVGYDDVHYFTRLFSKHIGVPPSQYAKQHLKK